MSKEITIELTVMYSTQKDWDKTEGSTVSHVVSDVITDNMYDLTKVYKQDRDFAEAIDEKIDDIENG